MDDSPSGNKIAKAKELYKQAGVLFDEGKNDLGDNSKLNRAIDLYTEALHEKPDYPDAYFNRALAYSILKKYDMATVDANKVVELEPNGPGGYFLLGLISEYTYDDGKAAEYFNISLAKDAQYEAAKKGLVRLAERKNRTDDELNRFIKDCNAKWAAASLDQSVYGFQIDAGTEWLPGLKDGEIKSIEGIIKNQLPEAVKKFLSRSAGLNKPQINVNAKGIKGDKAYENQWKLNTEYLTKNLPHILKKNARYKPDVIKQRLVPETNPDNLFLLPIFSHRFIALQKTYPNTSVVLSIFEVNDSKIDAVIYGSDILSYLRNEFLPKPVDSELLGPYLISASYQGDINKVKELIKLGARVNAKNLAGFTALIDAVTQNHPEIVKVLIEAHANPNQGNNVGATPLMFAARSDGKEILDMLIKAGAILDQGDVLGTTALMYAAQVGKIEAVRVLLDAGASVAAVTRRGHKAIVYAKQGGNADVIKMIEEAAANPKNNKPSTSVPNRPRLTPPGSVSDNVRALIAQAKENYNKKDYETAYKQLKEALNQEKSYDTLYSALIDVAMAVNRYNDVWTYSDAWMKLDETAPRPHNMMGLVLIKRDKNFSAGTIFFNNAIYLDSSNPVYYDNISFCYFQLKDYDQALKNANKALNLAPRNTQYLYDRATYYNAAGKKKEAILDLREVLKINPNANNAKELLGKLSGIALTDEQIKSGEFITPSVEVPKETFEIVAGMTGLKKKLMELIVYPFKNPTLAAKYGIKSGGAVLLYGPPGCGKTFIAKTTAGEAKVNFVQAKISDIRSMWSGQTSKNINAIFEFARKNKPCILFFDEVDALGGSRDAMGNAPWYREAVNTFLVEMDGASSPNEGILIIGATNAPWLIDPALKRSGRFSNLIYVPPPDKEARVVLFKLYLSGKPLENDINYEVLAELTNYFSAADIAHICTEALKIPWEEALNGGQERGVSMNDLRTSISKKNSTVAEWYNNSRQYVTTGSGEDYAYEELAESLKDYEKNMVSTTGSTYR